MAYVGIDPVVGLECSGCERVTRVAYSLLLKRVTDDEPIKCANCDREMRHDWTTVSVVQNIIRRRMREASEARDARRADSA
jgi:hypothetical protein